MLEKFDRDLDRKIMHQISDLTFRKDWIGCNSINIEKNELHQYKFHEIEFLNGINPFLSQEGGKRKTKKSRKIRKSKRRSAFKKSLLHPTEKSKKTHRK